MLILLFQLKIKQIKAAHVKTKKKKDHNTVSFFKFIHFVPLLFFSVFFIFPQK